MRRRLPLLGEPSAAASLHATAFSPDGCHERVQLAPCSIGIGDTSDGYAAAAFASELASALASLKRPVAIVLLGFEGVPVLPPALRARLRADGCPLSAHAVSAALPTLPDALVLPDDCVQLWVGLPAISVFAPALAVLLGADRPISVWPSVLRPTRGQFALELSQRRPGLAATLASSLNGHRLLPRGG